ncbi:hypothetical protein SO802_002654 [Lithocarpus litseifolius]|uniref:Uncharacterized protein n=1 Tax=Lithocarpus litseifolius TaxID=425828 RepID=A0AAW2DXV2_9ROSI
MVPQEEMVTSSDITLAGKIYKMVDDQARDLRRWGLTSLSWSKVSKKPIVVEENKEEEDWDEKDKTDYRRNKKFEAYLRNCCMKEKMEKMQLAFHKA